MITKSFTGHTTTRAFISSGILDKKENLPRSTRPNQLLQDQLEENSWREGWLMNMVPLSIEETY